LKLTNRSTRSYRPPRSLVVTRLLCATLLSVACLHPFFVQANNLPCLNVPTNNTGQELNNTSFPICGYPQCVKSGAITPARLGCSGSVLDSKCLCNQTLSPLACAPRGPSDEDNCWFEIEDWLNGFCPSVKVLDPNMMPDYLADCSLAHFVDQGCSATNGSVSVNCLCTLKRDAVTMRMRDCQTSGCWHKLSPGFSPDAMLDSTCVTGVGESYDQKGYTDYVTKVKNVRRAMLILLPIFVFLFAACIGIFVLDDDGSLGDGFCVFLTIFFLGLAMLYLAILTPPVHRFITSRK